VRLHPTVVPASRCGPCSAGARLLRGGRRAAAAVVSATGPDKNEGCSSIRSWKRLPATEVPALQLSARCDAVCPAPGRFFDCLPALGRPLTVGKVFLLQSNLSIRITSVVGI